MAYNAKANRLWKLFRLTLDEAAKIEKFQREHPIYRVLLSNRNAVEHNHRTGMIRGRMDWLLNRAYGMIEKVVPGNTSEVLLAMAVYHDSPPAVEALGKEVYGLMGQAKSKRKMIYGPPPGYLWNFKESKCTKLKVSRARQTKSVKRSRKS